MASAKDLEKPWTSTEKGFFRCAETPPDPGNFELGLVLGGTVSAGAYTAGVLDFLLEALDEWHKQQELNRKTTPDWKVCIKALSGTSGGGVLSVMFAKALSWKFPAIRAADSGPALGKNPFYQVWVESLDITKMLKTGDITSGQPVASALNAKCLEDAAAFIAAFPDNTGATVAKRDFVVEPLPVYLTLTNLRGVPCAVPYQDKLQQYYTDHAEYAKFSIFTHGGNTLTRPDTFGVSANPASGFMSWSDVTTYALGTSAFPVGLPPRHLTLPVQHLRLRPIVVLPPRPPEDATPVIPKIRGRPIAWQKLATDGTDEVPDDYAFACVDGGVLNNEPIELCRRELAGMVGKNERRGDLAQRAVVLIDPFFDLPDIGSAKLPDMLGEIGPLIGTWKSQARYATQDLQLAADNNCYSRFMITAVRDDGLTGAKAIATACLSAFGGFLSEKYRRHDYFLGRKNCRDFLMKEFVFPISNDKLFADWIARMEALGYDWKTLAITDSTGRLCLPVIPLFGSCLQAETVPPYPVGAFNPEAKPFQDAIDRRIGTVMTSIAESKTRFFLMRWLIGISSWLARHLYINKKVNAWIHDGLADWGLI